MKQQMEIWELCSVHNVQLKKTFLHSFFVYIPDLLTMDDEKWILVSNVLTCSVFSESFFK